MIFSCVDCKNRAAGCHGTCETYKRESEKHQQIAKNKNAEYEFKQYTIARSKHGKSSAYTTNNSNRF